MSYCEVDDLRLVLKGTSGSVPAAADKLEDEQLQVAIDNAEVEVNLALSNLYVVPLPVLAEPNPIKYITVDIACYLADLMYRMSKEYGSGANPLRLRYSRARSLLDGLLTGKYRLQVPSEYILSSTSEVFNPYDGDLITVEHLFGEAVYG